MAFSSSGEYGVGRGRDCSTAPFPGGSEGQCHPQPELSHHHLYLLLEEVDFVLLLNQLLLLLGDLGGHGADKGITEGPGPPPVPVPAQP